MKSKCCNGPVIRIFKGVPHCQVCGQEQFLLQSYALSHYPGEFKLVKCHPSNDCEQWYRKEDVENLLKQRMDELTTSTKSDVSNQRLLKELAFLIKEFFYYVDMEEVSDSMTKFKPNQMKISSCRVMDAAALEKILTRMREICKEEKAKS